MNILSIALTGFFVWSSLAGSGAESAVAAPETVQAAAAAPAKTLAVTLTAYNALPEQTDSDPDITASGAWTNPEVVAARSRDLAEELPFGTVIAVEASEPSYSCGYSTVESLIGYRVIADTMHERMRNRIDVLFDPNDTVMIGVNGEPKKKTNPARALGVCSVRVRVVGRVSVQDMPGTQSELAAMIGAKLAAK